ncbi:hypothetical protein Bca52824_063704 [Brassica carinata]|uniref:Uncharacterized protein n=1 Tax=Brassica carinata TaxID=52824 RepID=A0A8X7QEV5_BRACI|nr:hypothetical protein Bca52824_063704 [Brassica carinata]
MIIVDRYSNGLIDRYTFTPSIDYSSVISIDAAIVKLFPLMRKGTSPEESDMFRVCILVRWFHLLTELGFSGSIKRDQSVKSRDGKVLSPPTTTTQAVKLLSKEKSRTSSASSASIDLMPPSSSEPDQENRQTGNQSRSC